MNSDRTEGKWQQIKGRIKEQWGKLTDDEIDQAEGKWDQLSGRIQERYGRSRDEVDREMREFRTRHERSESDLR